MPTATWKSWLRSGSAHCDLQLAVEVRQCPLGSGARGGGPAVPTGIWTARRRRRVMRRRRRKQRRRRRRRRRTALIKSNDPHLAGGEKQETRTTRNQKNKKKHQKNKMTRPNSLPLLPPLGCAILFFIFIFCFCGFCFFWFLIFWSMLVLF